jgi:hypothetical protein
LANPRFHQFQIRHFGRGKIENVQALLRRSHSGKGGAAYGELLREFSVAALAGVANSAGPHVAVPWFLEGLKKAEHEEGITRENTAIIYMLRRYLQTADPVRERKPHPDGEAFLDAVLANPEAALARKWNLGHRGNRVSKLFEIFPFAGLDPVPADIYQDEPAPAQVWLDLPPGEIPTEELPPASLVSRPKG